MAARRRQANQATLIRHVTRYSLATNQMLQQLQQAFIAAHASTVDALHQAQAELYAIVETDNPGDEAVARGLYSIRYRRVSKKCSDWKRRDDCCVTPFKEDPQ
jgi:hypothetical protein